jgi:hypothetical protein
VPGSFDQQGPISSIIATLDELDNINPEMAAAIREQEEQHLKMLNESLRSMPPEEMIKRLKGVLWRLVPVLRLSEMMQLDYGAEVLSVNLRTALSTITDALKWIGYHNEIDPMEPFGDDTTIVAIRDIVLGQEPPDVQHDTLGEDPEKGDNEDGGDGKGDWDI